MAFQIIPEYWEYPRTMGVCFTCASSKQPDDILIDLGVMTDTIEDLDGNIHGYQTPVICSRCIQELAGMVGCVTPDKIERDNVDHWRARAEQAERENANMKNILQRVDKAIA